MLRSKGVKKLFNFKTNLIKLNQFKMYFNLIFFINQLEIKLLMIIQMFLIYQEKRKN